MANLYGLVAEFENQDGLVDATRRAHDQGYRRMDAYAPFPVDGLSEALGFRRTHISLVVLIATELSLILENFLRKASQMTCRSPTELVA